MASMAPPSTPAAAHSTCGHSAEGAEGTYSTPRLAAAGFVVIGPVDFASRRAVCVLAPPGVPFPSAHGRTGRLDHWHYSASCTRPRRTSPSSWRTWHAGSMSGIVALYDPAPEADHHRQGMP